MHAKIRSLVQKLLPQKLQEGLFAPPRRPHKSALIAAAALAAPGVALADETLKLAGNNAWPVYVYGNPRVVYDILTSAALLINPPAGDSGFRFALYTLSLVGFLTLAVKAGYDPGKNFVKMFTYIIFVWTVTLFTFNISVNADVIDVLSADGNNAYVVQRAPALAVVPMSFMFKVGRYLDDKTQTIYTIPDTFKTNTKSVGTFNLFGKMVEASSRFTLQNTYLKQSIANYTTDCVLPALATNRVSATLPDGSVLRGAEALKHSTNYWATLGTAQHQSIFTKYYPNLSSTDWATNLPPGITGSLSLTDPNISPSAGLVVTCSDAYTAMSGDLDREAESLKTLAAKEFSSTGTTTLFESIMNEMLVAASTAGVSPASAIKQQALLNYSSEAFRSAAVSAGNNEVMQSLALAQADVQQKSTWAAGFATFNNMMGYVYVVLQAFIFAITPIIVLALVIPGMGTAIVGNYMQIMLWLALWPPMLGIINYVITLFGIDAVKGAYSVSQGYVTLANSSLVSERTANLTLAAQFLGTMVPMISWGIIKGAMAFTEFISAGVGSQFAGQAGAQAATGNFSLNQGSMDNLTLNKMSTTMSAAVGFDAIRGMSGASAVQLSGVTGGANYSIAGKDVDFSRQLQQNASLAESYQKSVSTSVSSALNNAASWSQAVDNVKNTTSGAQQSEALQMLAQLATSTGASSQLSDAIRHGNSSQVRQAAGADTSTEMGGTLSLGGKLGNFGGGANAGKNAKYQTGVHVDDSASQARDQQASNGLSSGRGTVDSTGASTSASTSAGRDTAHRESATKSWNQQESLSKAKQLSETRSQQLQATIAEARSLSMATNMDATRAQALLSQLTSLTNGSLQNLDQLAQQRAGLAAAVTSDQQKTASITGNPQHNGAGRPAAAARVAASAEAAGREAMANGGTVSPADIRRRAQETRGQVRNHAAADRAGLEEKRADVTAAANGLQQGGMNARDVMDKTLTTFGAVTDGTEATAGLISPELAKRQHEEAAMTPSARIKAAGKAAGFQAPNDGEGDLTNMPN